MIYATTTKSAQERNRVLYSAVVSGKCVNMAAMGDEFIIIVIIRFIFFIEINYAHLDWNRGIHRNESNGKQ